MSYPHENRVVAASDSERVSQIAVSVVNACFTKHIIDHTPLLLPLPGPLPPIFLPKISPGLFSIPPSGSWAQTMGLGYTRSRAVLGPPVLGPPWAPSPQCRRIWGQQQDLEQQKQKQQ